MATCRWLTAPNSLAVLGESADPASLSVHRHFLLSALKSKETPFTGNLGSSLDLKEEVCDEIPSDAAHGILFPDIKQSEGS